MREAERREAIRLFCQKWKNKGKEDEDDQKFWIEILQNILGVEKPTDYIEFQKKVIVDGNTKRIDAYIPETRVIIEQKSLGISLEKKGSQSGGIELTPYEQAKRYNDNLPHSEKARWIVTSNFAEIWIYNMEAKVPEPEKLMLENIKDQYYRLNFLIDKKEEKVSVENELSVKAGDYIAKIYDLFLKQYKDPNSSVSLQSLNKLCVRLVFCFYAEDAYLFPEKNYFQKYTKKYTGGDYRKSIIEVFKILNIPESERDPYIEADLNAFPYVNGGLFKEENIEIPRIDDELREAIIEASDFDWSQISPTIFGAVFESTLNPETRHIGGMHYTSIENIHKVIDPLFFDDLNEEFDKIKAISKASDKAKALKAFQDKLASLKFLDPACGSGNFLTETYVSLRRLENKIILELNQGQGVFGAEGFNNPIKVSINQFYGIEINDFAVTVAKTALWIAESQMMRETQTLVRTELDFLPLKTNATIVEGNALRIDWETVVPKSELNYIIGNPPFVCQDDRTIEQRKDMIIVFGEGSIENKQDYVIAWYKKALDFMNMTNKGKIKTCFVSTNSICQGESVSTFWHKMFDENTVILYAYRSFVWESEAIDKASVICVIIAFTNCEIKWEKKIFDGKKVIKASYINAYLRDDTNIWITNRKNVNYCNKPKLIKGSEPSDGGNFFLNIDEKNKLEKLYPQLKKYIRPFLGSKEFLNRKSDEITRFCLWFEDCNPADIINIKEIKDRLEKIANKRIKSSSDRIQKKANTPHLFCQIRQPKEDYLLFPRHSAEKYTYIPLGFVSSDIILGDSCSCFPGASLYDFGVLISKIHMIWVQLVCGRLGNGVRYNPSIYNNFPWCSPTTEQKVKIEKTAGAILNARDKNSDCSLAQMYGENMYLFTDLIKSHKANDEAVLDAYGLSKNTSDSEILNFLKKKYQELAKKQ